MGLEGVRDKKLLYHLTKLSNMETIIEYGLLPRKYLKTREIHFGDVADPEIICRREETGLDQYTPFHFHPYSAFDVAVKNTHPHDKFVYICIKRALAEFKNFKILPNHPLSQNGYNQFDKFHCAVKKSTDYVNLIQTDRKLEGVATVLYLVQTSPPKNREELIEGFKSWSQDKSNRFTDQYIADCIDYLENTAIISQDLYGNYELEKECVILDSSGTFGVPDEENEAD